MRRSIISLLIMSVLLLCSCSSVKETTQLTINEVYTKDFATVKEKQLKFTETRTLDAFDSIFFESIAVKVNIHFADEYKIVIKTNDDFLNLITSDIIGNALIVDMKETDYKKMMILCDVYMPTIRNIKCRGIIDVVFDKGSCEALNIDVYGKLSLDGTEFYANKTNIDIDGYGSIKLGKAQVEMLHINIDGVAFVKAKRYKANDVVVNISGVGKVNVYSVDKFKKDVSGIGFVINHGKKKGAK